MPLKILLGLIASNLVWSLHPTCFKILLENFSVGQAAWLRYASAAAAFLLWRIGAALRRGGVRTPSDPFRIRDLGWLALLGFASFFYAPVVMNFGLIRSQAIDNALIIAVEPVLTSILAWIFLREALQREHWGAFALALTGFTFLSGLTLSRVMHGLDRHMTGNLLILSSLIGESVYSIISSKLLARNTRPQIFGAAIFFGVFLLTATIIVSGEGLPPLAKFRWMDVLAFMIMGPIGTTLTYLYWMYALSYAPVSSLALTLFIQPVMGVVWGFLFLGERLSLPQAGGGLLILVGVALPTLFSQKRPKIVTQQAMPRLPSC